MRTVRTWVSRQTGTIAILGGLALAAGIGLLASAPASAQAEKTPIRIGILEPPAGAQGDATALKDVMLMLIDEQNRKGGLLSRKLEPVIISAGADPQARKAAARELLTRAKVAVVFGASLDETRKGLVPLFTELNGILFDPAPGAGKPPARNVFHTGAAPNQLAIPAVDYLAEERNVKRWVLAGTNGAWSRAITHILEAYLHARGVKAQDIMIVNVPDGHADWSRIVADMRAFDEAAAGPDAPQPGEARDAAVISTIIGTANNGFYKTLAAQGVTAAQLPVLSLTLGNADRTRLDLEQMQGQLAARNYVMSVSTPDNKVFLQRWRAFTKDPERRASDGVEAHYIGFNMWVKAVAKAGTTQADKVIETLPGIRQLNLTGGISEMQPNHHISRPVFIGEIGGKGTLRVTWKTPGLVPGVSWDQYLKGSDTLSSDWDRYNCEDYDNTAQHCVDPAPEAQGAPQGAPQGTTQAAPSAAPRTLSSPASQPDAAKPLSPVQKAGTIPEQAPGTPPTPATTPAAQKH
ncbi:transporter substrate-binding protein [Xanthobacter sp. TB0139]|uniref:transporter substrate-binding protein n=1 Tax=Xanthobacter sp. TB0139 TaxID=3459178 RepID=UPI00403A76FC